MPPRFSSLDGVRGVAALIVVVMHVQPMISGHLFEHGYLMVDLFFLMSGFVLEHRYGERLAQGGQGAWFVGTRLLRLYPLAFLGLLLGAGVFGLQALLGRSTPADQCGGSLLLSVFFLPWLAGGLVAPFDGPAWSLECEFWVNCAFGYCARHLSNTRLVVLVAVSGVFLGFAALGSGGLDGGNASHDPGRGGGDWAFLMGWARIAFSFPLGLLICRLRPAGAQRKSTSPAILLVVAILLFISNVGLGTPAIYDLAIVGLVFPVLLIFCSSLTLPASVAKVCARLGALSYGLYILHGPILVLFHSLEPTALPVGWRPYWFACAGILSVAGSVAADKWIDSPVRRLVSGLGARGAVRSLPLRV